jgi:hypothetical protein
MAAALVESLEPHKNKVIPFLSARKACGISPNTSLDRQLAIVIDRSGNPRWEARKISKMSGSERATYLIRNSLAQIIESLKGDDERTKRARLAYQDSVSEGRISHIPDHYLPDWYHAAKPPFSAYATFIEQHGSEINV